MPRQIVGALGFRVHTGWAVAVAVAPDCDVLERRRITYEPLSTRFLYHQAAEKPIAEAEVAISAARSESLAAARREIGQLISALAERNIRIQGACVPGGNCRLPTALAEILAAHAKIHAAEGSFYRDTLADACALLNLQVERVPERDLLKVAADALNRTPETLLARLLEIGKRIGSPWGEDQKNAALAATVALTRVRPALAQS